MSFTFAIGDIHGCRVQLDALIEAIEMGWPAGHIVFLGDYVDRGPDSRGVVERIMAGPGKPDWQWTALKGNHEDMMVQAIRNGQGVQTWLVNGGEETLQSFGGHVSDDVLDWLNDLPMLHQDRHRIFVHGGVDETVPLTEQTGRVLLWRRPLPGESGDYWGRHLVHGHTPDSENPRTTGNRTNIDSACVFGGHLTAAVFDDDIAGPPIRFIRIAHRS